MRDFLKRELALDDYVVFITPSYSASPSYRSLTLGKIIRFTNTMCVVSYNKGRTELRQQPDQLVKVEGEDLTAYFLETVR